MPANFSEDHIPENGGCVRLTRYPAWDRTLATKKEGKKRFRPSRNRPRLEYSRYCFSQHFAAKGLDQLAEVYGSHHAASQGSIGRRRGAQQLVPRSLERTVLDVLSGRRRIQPTLPKHSRRPGGRRSTSQGRQSGGESPFIISGLVSCTRPNNLKLDFVSFHCYANDGKGGVANAHAILTLYDYLSITIAASKFTGLVSNESLMPAGPDKNTQVRAHQSTGCARRPPAGLFHHRRPARPGWASPWPKIVLSKTLGSSCRLRPFLVPWPG